MMLFPTYVLTMEELTKKINDGYLKEELYQVSDKMPMIAHIQYGGLSFEIPHLNEISWYANNEEEFFLYFLDIDFLDINRSVSRELNDMTMIKIPLDAKLTISFQQIQEGYSINNYLLNISIVF